LVTGQHNLEVFYNNGIQGVECIRTILHKNGFDMNDFQSILDFGCGCGRILRHWNDLKGPEFYGVDYNSNLLNWCRKYLPFADYKVNQLTLNLKFKDASFDFIYAISVFTHLSEKLQFFWMKELKRVLKPEGILFVTVHGATRLHQLSKEDQQRFISGKVIVREEEFSGSNRCCTYHPEQYVRNHLAKDFRVLDFLPGGAKDANQDVYLLQKTHKQESKSNPINHELIHDIIN
jgi:ubiquinone/menaquinone biosynthesis C-methylase UbiE